MQQERSRDGLGALPAGHKHETFMRIELNIYSGMSITRSYRNLPDSDVRAIVSQTLNSYVMATAFQEKPNDFMALHQD